MDTLSAELILSGLETATIGRYIVYRSEVLSTNSEARRMAAEGSPEGTLVLAEHQIAGRGRLDRRWIAPPQSSLLLSLVFRPQLAANRIQLLTMLCGLAVVDAIELETGLRTALKWPNDIVHQGDKLGGILTEAELGGSRIDYVVVGIGLNVNLDPAQLGDGLLQSATSLSHALGRPVDRLPLLLSLLQQVEARYLDLGNGIEPVEEWTRRLDTLGKRITITEAGVRREGTAEGVDDNGALRVRLLDGQLVTVIAGDIMQGGSQ
jgi:BirA family biotin operon repressor/biotin-[acetyl-CoA-carboxylase] ligase